MSHDRGDQFVTITDSDGDSLYADYHPVTSPATRTFESPFDRVSVRDKDERWPDIAGAPIRMVKSKCATHITTRFNGNFVGTVVLDEDDALALADFLYEWHRDK